MSIAAVETPQGHKGSHGGAAAASSLGSGCHKTPETPKTEPPALSQQQGQVIVAVGREKSQHQLLQGSTEEAAASTLKSQVSPAAKAPILHPIPRISPLSTRLSPVLLEHDALSREPEEELEQRFPARSGVKPGKVPTRDP